MVLFLKKFTFIYRERFLDFKKEGFIDGSKNNR